MILLSTYKIELIRAAIEGRPIQHSTDGILDWRDVNATHQGRLVREILNDGDAHPHYRIWKP